MIQVVRTDKPTQLTPDEQQRLTELFKADTSKRVWDKDYIRNSLLLMTHEKCCYCECRVGTGTSDMHVEHFRPKLKYPDLVVEWDNLLPACAHCNRSKLDHDTQLEPIVHPVNDRPQDFFYLSGYRYRCKNSHPNSIARRTLAVLNLNDSVDKVLERFRIGEKLSQKIDEIHERAIEYQALLQTDTVKRNKVTKGCRDILRFGDPMAEYSAFMATLIHNDSDYAEIKRILQEQNVWSEELEDLDRRSKDSTYETRATE